MKPVHAGHFFVKQLLRWNQLQNRRLMPWKGEKDPYKIWLSEIILQQTRVEQGLAYYNRFVETYPTVNDLAAAEDTAVFKLWEGLGYYTRCKNLLATARLISSKYKGKFPDSYEDILALKGVGPYTAAAISSFAFNLPYAVVDGNVFRVLARFYGNATPIDSTGGKQQFTELAQALLDKKQPGIYNQALMDFGALVCKPQLPLCAHCPMQEQCVAYNTGSAGRLPVKEKTILRKTRWFNYLLIEYRNQLYVRKRPAGDIWENLYEFILVETAGEVDIAALKEMVGEQFLRTGFEVENISQVYRQQLTHQTIFGRFIRIKSRSALSVQGWERVGKNTLNELPFPKLISSYLKDKTVSLNLF